VVGIGEPLIGRLLTYDALAMFQAARTDCVVCGTAPSIKTLTDSEATCRTEITGKWPRFKPAELQQLLQSSGGAPAKTPLLVDVREQHEYATGHLAGSVNIPLGELGQRLPELPTDSAVVFICRSGRRSRTACELAARGGVRSVSDLEGGLIAWAAAIDPSIKVA
jgi:rhodanese-related sulfurtransferase